MHRVAIGILFFISFSNLTFASKLPVVGDWYIGGEVGASDMEVSTEYENNNINSKDMLSSVFIGKKFKSYGVEVGATEYAGFASSVSSIFTLNHQDDASYYIDFIYYSPSILSLEAVTGLGVGYFKSKKNNNTIDEKDSKFTPRALVGLQYKFIGGLHFRLMLRHHRANKFYKHDNSVMLGALFKI